MIKLNSERGHVEAPVNEDVGVFTTDILAAVRGLLAP